jgi:hypothetical protein
MAPAHEAVPEASKTKKSNNNGRPASWGSSSDGNSDDIGRCGPAPVQQDDEMFFDPDADDDDERTLREKRQGRHTDALLSCPCCFELLCIECQQHESGSDLYRAMFVQNCCLVEADGVTEVACKTCDCRVGEYDSNTELYVFYGVLPSEA